MPKSITFGTGLPSAIVTRMFDGFRSRWITPFWCACCTAWQTCGTVRAAFGGEPVVSQNSVSGMPRTSSITKYGPSAGRRAGIEHARDARMVHHRQRLPFDLESRQDALVSRPSLRNLIRHLATDRLRAVPPQTSPMPPSPSAWSSVYAPITVPAAVDALPSDGNGDPESDIAAPPVRGQAKLRYLQTVGVRKIRQRVAEYRVCRSCSGARVRIATAGLSECQQPRPVRPR